MSFDSEIMQLGELDQFEVWFIPKNKESYSTRVLQCFLSLDKAVNFKNENEKEYHGEIVILRNTNKRSLINIG